MTELGLNLHHAGRANQPDLTICPTPRKASWCKPRTGPG